MTIASKIKDQIGSGALMMLGAGTLIGLDSGLRFKIGMNAKRINHIEIKLNSMDTYDIRYLKTSISRATLAYRETIISKENGVYGDMLRKSIESNTGLYTKL